MPDSGFFDFVRQHRGQCDHRARRAAMRELTIHLVRNAAFLEHHDDVAGPLADGRDVEIDLTISTRAGGTEINLVLVDRRAAGANLVDQRQ